MPSQVLKQIDASSPLTILVEDAPGAGGANYVYGIPFCHATEPDIERVNKQIIAFQNGPVVENGINGVQNETLLEIVRHRLQCFQAGPFPCRENAIALTKIEEALLWLRIRLNKRTSDRLSRGVEGKSEA
jgi:hypothetical protein